MSKTNCNCQFTVCAFKSASKVFLEFSECGINGRTGVKTMGPGSHSLSATEDHTAAQTLLPTSKIQAELDLEPSDSEQLPN